MTIIVAVSTRDAVVLGCDSLTSSSEYGIFPTSGQVEFATDAEGNEILDASGNRVFAYRPEEIRRVVTAVWGGASKMFTLLEDDTAGCETSVAAMTTGIAFLNGVSIAELAKQYKRRTTSTSFRHVADALADFLAFMRGHWDAHVAAVGPSFGASVLRFLVSGYCCDDERIETYRISVDANTIENQWPAAPYYGVAWDGQSNFAARLMLGIDPDLQLQVSRSIIDALDAQRESLISSFASQMTGLGLTGDSLTLEFDEFLPPSPPWSMGQPPVSFAGMSPQTAIEFAALLVNAESGMQKFVTGIPVVGGRTRIGILRRNVPFAMLNEPSLSHTHTGYLTDA